MRCQTIGNHQEKRVLRVTFAGEGITLEKRLGLGSSWWEHFQHEICSEGGKVVDISRLSTNSMKTKRKVHCKGRAVECVVLFDGLSHEARIQINIHNILVRGSNQVVIVNRNFKVHLRALLV